MLFLDLVLVVLLVVGFRLVLLFKLSLVLLGLFVVLVDRLLG